MNEMLTVVRPLNDSHPAFEYGVKTSGTLIPPPQHLAFRVTANHGLATQCFDRPVIQSPEDRNLSDDLFVDHVLVAKPVI